MKVTGHCDGQGCTSKSEIDVSAGKPPGWWTVRVTGQVVSNDHQPMFKRVDHTAVLCDQCFKKLGVPIHEAAL